METVLVVNSISLWVVVLLNLLLTLGLARRIRNAAFPVMESLKVGQKAPSFSAQTLQGQTMTLADYADRATAFLFVSPHCTPCRDELPHLRELLPKAKNWGAELVLVSDEGEETTRPFVEETVDGLTVLVAPRDRNPLITDYKVPGTPSFYLLDAHGKVEAAGFGVSDLVEKLEALSHPAKGGV
jgi:peroxiredoxin